MTTLPTADRGTDDAIALRDVVVERGHATVLTVGSLEIPRGVTAVVGPNGSGKSTLLHVIAGLLPAGKGVVTVGGRAPHQGRRDVAYVLQAQHASEHLLVTADEVVGLARAATLGAFRPMRRGDRDAVTRATDRLDVTALGRRHLADMSGGQRQRVFVAQGLAQEADVLLLDEPMAGLDIVSAEAIRTVIEQERSAGRFRRSSSSRWHCGRSVCARRTAPGCSISAATRLRSTTASTTRTTNTCTTITSEGVDRLARERQAAQRSQRP